MPRTDLSRFAPAPRINAGYERFPNNAFIGACGDFDALIAKLQAARAAHFGVDVDAARNWGDVGSVVEVNEHLARALAFLSGTEA